MEKRSKEGTVEHWVGSSENQLDGSCDLKKGFNGRSRVSLPPLMEALGLAEVEHNAGNNRMRAI